MCDHARPQATNTQLIRFKTHISRLFVPVRLFIITVKYNSILTVCVLYLTCGCLHKLGKLEVTKISATQQSPMTLSKTVGINNSPLTHTLLVRLAEISWESYFIQSYHPTCASFHKPQTGNLWLIVRCHANISWKFLNLFQHYIPLSLPSLALLLHSIHYRPTCTGKVNLKETA